MVLQAERPPVTIYELPRWFGLDSSCSQDPEANTHELNPKLSEPYYLNATFSGSPAAFQNHF